MTKKVIDDSNLGHLVSKAKAAFWPKEDVINVNLADVATSGDYNDLSNKPTIPDVSNFITKSVNDLTNYYLKSETYTKEEVAALIGAIQQFHYEIATSTSAVTSPANNVLYLIGPTGSGSDKYEEYVYDETKSVAERWIKIGDTTIDLSGYVTTQALNTALAGKQNSLVSGTNIKTLNGDSLLGSGNLTSAYIVEVSLTLNSETNKYSASIVSGSIAEINAALLSNKTVIAKCVSSGGTVYYLRVVSNDTSEIMFGGDYQYFGVPISCSLVWAESSEGEHVYFEHILQFSGIQVSGNGNAITELTPNEIGGYQVAATATKGSTFVDTAQQTLTDAQKSQARTNIGAGTYSKPSGGIPASDIASGVIPAAPVNADWNASSGLAQILNKPTIPTTYAGSPTAGGFANKTVAIPFGNVDSTSTATEITATVDNFPETLTDGVCAYIRNNVISSASGWTLNINGTGEKPVYASNSDATRTTSIFSAASTYLFVYNANRVEGGCWDIYYGYNANDNTVGYILRTNGMSMPTTSACYRYRLLFTSADKKHFVPANESSSSNATAKRTTTQTPIDPFGSIRYYGSTSILSSGANPGVTVLWEQYSVTLGYSFNRKGSALTLTAHEPVYIKCAPQADGSAIIDAEEPYVQELPTTADGKIYIYLGVATSATAVEMTYYHPVYYYDGTRIVIWPGKQDTLTFDIIPTENSTNPVTSGGIYNAIIENEQVVAAALNDLNDRLDNIDIPTDNIQNYYTGLNSTSDVIDPKEGDIFYKVNENWTQIYPSLTTTSSISESTRTYNFGSGYVTRLKMTDISSEISSISYVNANNETVNFGDQFSSEIIFPVGIKSITLSNDTSEPPTAPSLYRNDTTYTYMEYYRGQWINRPVIISNINGFSSDDQIPTAKAVYDLNLNNQRVIVGGENDDTYTFEQNAYGSFYNDSIPEGTILQYGYPKYTSGETTEISNLDTGFWPSSTCKFLYWSPGGYSYVERINIMFYEAGTYNFVTNAPGNMDSSSEYAFSFTITDSDLNYLEDGYTQTSGEFTIRTVDDVYIEPGEYVYLYYTGDTPPNVKIASYKSTYIMHNGMWEDYVFPRHGSVGREISDGFVDGGQVWEAIHPQILNTNYIFPNQMHKFGTVTGSKIWTLVTPTYDDIINHYFWTFDTGSTAPTITWPSGLTWPGGSPPAILPNKHYEISVLNNIVAWMEV